MENIQQQLDLLRKQLRYLKWYGIISSLLVSILLLSAFRKSATGDIIESLRAEKIEIVEADGMVKLSLFNKKHLPTAVIDGRKLTREGGGEAGLMFYNEEGEECGSLIYNGAKGNNEASLTFDKYKQDQVLQLVSQQDKGLKGMIVSDRPDHSLAETFDKVQNIHKKISNNTEHRKALTQLEADGLFGRQRLLVGQTGKTTGLFFIYDTNGHKRLEMTVNEKNEPVIVFSSEKEKPVKTIHIELSQLRKELGLIASCYRAVTD
jgi:hypothetical protein